MPCTVHIRAPGVVPGVASFALKPHDVGSSLKPLLQYAMKLLHSETWHIICQESPWEKCEVKNRNSTNLDGSEEKDDWAKIPVYLRATAGMRLLFPDERENILETCRVKGEHMLGPFAVAKLMTPTD